MRFAFLGDTFVDLNISIPSDQVVAFENDCTVQNPIQVSSGGSACNSALHFNSILKSSIFSDKHKIKLFTSFSSNSCENWRQVILEKCKKHDLEIVNIPNSEKSGTGTVVIFSNSSDHGFITYPGAVGSLSIEDIFSHCQDLSSNDHLHVGGLYCLKKLSKDFSMLFSKLHEESPNMTFSLDMNTASGNQWKGEWTKSLKFIDIFTLNETEARGLTNESEIEQCFDKIFSLGVKNICIIKQGSKGASFRTRNMKRSILVSALTVGVQDLLGAGDAFVAAFLFYYLVQFDKSSKLEDLKSCVTAAVRAGTIIVQTVGATTHVLNEVDLGGSPNS